MKTLKVFWNGKYLRDVYPFATRFEVIKYRMRRFFFQAVKLTILLAILVLGLFLAYRAGKQAVGIKTIEIGVRDNLPEKIEEFKAGVLTSLKGCESPGYKEQDAPIILDSNAKMSIGLYMFQIKTVQWYYKTLYNKDITRKDAVLVALDENKARNLAADILFTTKNASLDWQNCSDKLNLVADLKVIKQLEK